MKRTKRSTVKRKLGLDMMMADAPYQRTAATAHVRITAMQRQINSLSRSLAAISRAAGR